MPPVLQPGIAAPPLFPVATPLRILLPGAAGLVLWETFARLAGHLRLGHAPDPTALIGMAFGIPGSPAPPLHLLLGLGIAATAAHLAGGAR